MQSTTPYLTFSHAAVLSAASNIHGVAIGLVLIGSLIVVFIFFVMLWDLRQALGREARLNKPYRRMLLESLVAGQTPPPQTPEEQALARLADRYSDTDDVLNRDGPDTWISPAKPQNMYAGHSDCNASSVLGGIADRYIESKEVLLEQSPASLWDHGCATHQGRVRTENQDAVASIRIGDQVLLIGCDGCGGMPEGRAAARLAVDAAQDTVMDHLECGSASTSLDELCLAGIKAAQKRLQHVADTHGLDTAGSLRCTMIVVLASSHMFHFAYLGDGGIYHHRDGETRSLMEAHKDERFSNIITSSMGPMIQGEPGQGSVERQPGDLLWVCSDGIADRAEPQPLSEMLTQRVIQSDGDISDAIDQILSALADCREPEDDLIVFDDNMLIAAVADRRLASPSPTIPEVNSDA